MILLRNSLCLISLLCLTTCKNASVKSPADGIGNSLAALVQEAVDDSMGEVPGVSMTVLSPSQGISWSGAAGYADRAATTPLTSEHPFRIASITKTFVAAAILRLQEMDSLEITDPIAHHISEEHLALLRSDGYEVDRITLKHCLLHTSGIYDYAVSTPAYLEAVTQNPKRRWTRTDQLRFAIDLGEPLWPPGAGFRYSDTGYILLGEVIERQLDSTLAYGLRQLLGFEKLQLQTTWLETLEPAPADLLPQVGRYYNRLDLTDWDNSGDLWGGGGLISTTEDIANFVQALFTGKVFVEANTLRLFLAGPDAFPESYQPEQDPQYMDYRSGHFAYQLYGKEVLYHSGFWGTSYLYLPHLEATIAVNYTSDAKDRLLKKTALLLENTAIDGPTK